MGCGAVCGATSPVSNKHQKQSHNLILELLPKIKINKPLLPDKAYKSFAKNLLDGVNVFTLKVGPFVGSDEELNSFILQKWKIVLYGLDKGDDIYKKCLAFQVRDEKQMVTYEQNLSINAGIVQNKSYHELKQPNQYHECFTQIEKDLNRTFEFKQEKQKIFQNILKRIANYFPSMGYTQGINFIVGYLLILGYSQADTFWMFVHLALNKRYLILGLYEDGFPLSYIYTLIFKNMLKRLDNQLFCHLYNDLMLDDSMWIFKWFITYYIYSFPLNTVKYVWDMVIEMGGIALVYYAISLVLHLKKKLMSIEDPCDISQFLSSLKNLHSFNQNVRIDRVVERAYEIKLMKCDLQGLNEFKYSFYKKYYQLLMQETIDQKIDVIDTVTTQDTKTHGFQKKDKLLSHVHLWYVKILKERMEFRSTDEMNKQRLTRVPEMLKNEYLDLQKSICELSEQIIQNQSIKIAKQQEEHKKQQDNTYFHSLVHDQLFNIEVKDHQQNQKTNSTLDKKYKIVTKISYDIQEQIDQLEDQSDSNNEELYISQQLTSEHTHEQPSINIEEIEQSDSNSKVPQKFNLQLNTIVSQFEQRKKTLKDPTPKVNNIRMITEQKRSGLSLAGQNILCNLSISNSQVSSVSSKNISFKPRKQKQNNIGRYNKNAKVRTQQNSLPSGGDRSSEHQSSIDQNMDKESYSGFSHRQNPKIQRPSFGKDHHFDRMTQHDLMTNSHCPEQGIDTQRPSKDLNSQIQIFNGDSLFKKKKRLYNRNSNITSINTNNGIQGLRISGINNKKMTNDGLNYQQQESIQSILQPYSNRKQSRNKQRKVDSMKYEIESIK